MEFAGDVIDTLLKILPGIVGVIVGRYLTKKKEKTTLAFDFHKELNTTEMSKHRNTAGDFIRQYPIANIEELEKIDKEKSICVYVIMRFYQRLWLSVKYKQISEKITRDLFAANFYYWYYVYFEKNAVPAGWWSVEQIKDLSMWFEKKLPKERHTLLKQKNEDLYQTRINDFRSRELKNN